MKAYNIIATVIRHDKIKEEIVKDTIVLADDEDLNECIQMLYGSFFNIIEFHADENNNIHISKNYIKQEMIKLQ